MTDAINTPGNRASANAPLLTFIICSYNQEQFIEQAIRGAFSQDYTPLEIIISDDCSTDRTWHIIEHHASNYDGDHTLIINRNARNLGLIEHVNKVIDMANGELIIGSAGDDISLPQRSRCLAKAYIENGKGPALIHSDVIEIDVSGREIGLMRTKWGRTTPDLFETALSDSLHIGASSAFSRPLLESFPPISKRDAFEDLVWGFRATLLNAVIFVDKPLVMYRTGVGLSWLLHEKKSDSEKHFIESEEKKLRVYQAVLEQRLTDIKIIKNSHLFSTVKTTIVKQIRKKRVMRALINRPLHSIIYFLLTPAAFIKAFRSHRKRKHRLKKKHELNL